MFLGVLRARKRTGRIARKRGVAAACCVERAEAECPSLKEKHLLREMRSVGIFSWCFPCGIVPWFHEVVHAESIALVFHLLCRFLLLHPGVCSVAYDDACHLLPAVRKWLETCSADTDGGAEADAVSRLLRERLAGLDLFIDAYHTEFHATASCQAALHPRDRVAK